MISSKLHSEITGILDALEIGEELFWQPVRQVTPGAWTGHLAIAFWLVKAAQPTVFVELGTHSGNSYSAFCQAIAQMGLPTRAFAVDTWLGDEHSGLYGKEVFRALQAFNESHFGPFSKLLRTTFDEARSYFADNSIDLLHIDGLHTYEAVKRDFETWQSALSQSSVVVFHDTNVRERDFGVWKLWQELSAIYPSFEFHHSEGLGVLGVGPDQLPLLRRLFELGRDSQSSAVVRRIFAARGEVFVSRSQVLDLTDRFSALSSDFQNQLHRVAAVEQDVASRDATLADREQEIRTNAETISNLQQKLIGSDATLADREQEIRTNAETISNLQQKLIGSDATLADREQEIRTNAEAIRDLQQKLIGSDATLREWELTIFSKDKIIGAKQRKIEELNESAACLREQLLEATHRLDAERSAASERIELLQQESASVQHTLGLIESSTAWKLASRLRSAFQSYPRVRLYTRRLARLIWWTVTFQLLDRIRARRRLFKMRDMIAHSTLFDAAWYVSQYAGIAEAGCDPALHYALYGATERRDPGPRFDAEAYLLSYPEVAEAGANPLIHYLEHGASEGRVISPVDAPPVAAEVPAEVPRHEDQNWVSSHDTIKDDEETDEYGHWVAQYDSISKDDEAAIRGHLASLLWKPLVSILMPVYNPRSSFLRKAIDSVRAQLYPNWELCVADDASTDPVIREVLQDYASRDNRIKIAFRSQNGSISAASNSALALATGDFIALMDHDDELPVHALYMIAVELNAHSDASIIYSDEDKINVDGRRYGPYFKTDWDQELFYSQNMVNHLGVYRTSLVRQIGGFREGFEGSQDYDLVLRLVAETKPDRIRHIPHILYHWRLGDGVPTFSTDRLAEAVGSARRALAEYFATRGENVQITASRVPYWNRVARHLPNPSPRVSLLVPTRDQVTLLRNCVEGLLHNTRYSNLEVIIIDNNSREPDTLNYLERLRAESRVRILRIDGPFNFGAFNNRAVAAAEGEVIGFINNDIQVIDPGWLEEMVSQVVQPGVGAVGAKLYYHDDTVQHAGVVLGMHGVAAHGHRHFPRAAPGYYGRLQLVHSVSCITAACMVVLKSVFVESGGFDEVNLTVSYNDVDLCLEIRQSGYRIVWTPYAELYHLESASRGSDVEDKNSERARREYNYMRERWGEMLDKDPFYNPNLSLKDENFSLAFPPRILKPWCPVRAYDRPDGGISQSIVDAHHEWDSRGRARLQELLAGDRRLQFPCAEYPTISVIIVFRNKAHLSLMCLEALRENADLPYELIVVDNASDDDTHLLLNRLDGATILRNSSNVGFGPACVQGVEMARGDYLCFLNNDALLMPKALSAAIDDFVTDATVGAVGGKILLANGDLQEAGSIIWSDGTALGYGRGDNPDLHQYNFRRPVDFCSGAFLFTLRTLFCELGGFGSMYSPAYYEDADYCMKVWSRGLQVIYDPRAVVRHYESASSGNNDAATPLMATNQAVFVEAWGEKLKNYHFSPSANSIHRARFAALCQDRHLVYIDDAIPHRNMGAGYPRSNAILHQIVKQGYRVTCFASSSPLGNDEYADIPLDVELLDASKNCECLGRYLDSCDLVWISRPNNMKKYVRQVVARKPQRKYKVVYDAEAIFAERDYLQCMVGGERLPPETLEDWIAHELVPAKAADKVACVSYRDAERMAAAGVPSPYVVGHYLEPKPTPAPFHKRRGFLFVGRMHGGDDPNTDSMRYFCKEIWPRLRDATGAGLVIAGQGSEMFDRECKSPGVSILGAVDDLSKLYDQARVFVVPTRYAAGVPLKMYEAASFGLPAVVSTLVGQQIGWEHGEECLIAGSPDEFVEWSGQLYWNEALWNGLRMKSLRKIETDLNLAAFTAAITNVLKTTRNE